MKILNRKNTDTEKLLPIKAVQFGEGNFLRAFVDYCIDVWNTEQNFNCGVAVIQPLPNGMSEVLKAQEGLYTLFINGIENEKEIQEKRRITAIQKIINPYTEYAEFLNLAKEEQLQFMFSNTTEAGIVFLETDTLYCEPPQSFPAKATAFLYARYKHFNGASNKGLAILPCELIENNATALKKCILQYAAKWRLEPNFVLWLTQCNSFHNTLVDRIVPGYPKEDISIYKNQLELKDQLMVISESFMLWVIEGNDYLKKIVPVHPNNKQVLIVKDAEPYRTRKVRILNGAHTLMVPPALLFGKITVKETIEDDFMGRFIKDAIFMEILPTIKMPQPELVSFTKDVIERFKNPYLQHNLSSIALNSVSKFKVRLLPALLDYYFIFNSLPPRITFSLACLIRFYKEQEANTQKLPVQDNAEVIEIFNKVWKHKNHAYVAEKILAESLLWNQDLTKVEGLKTDVEIALNCLELQDVKLAFESFIACKQTENHERKSS